MILILSNNKAIKKHSTENLKYSPLAALGGGFEKITACSFEGDGSCSPLEITIVVMNSNHKEKPCQNVSKHPFKPDNPLLCC